jgi:hypothetical protein
MDVPIHFSFGRKISLGYSGQVSLSFRRVGQVPVSVDFPWSILFDYMQKSNRRL